MADSNIPEEYLNSNFDFGFTSVDSLELNNLINGNTNPTPPEEIVELQRKLDLILEMNSSCDGALAVKAQYDSVLHAKMQEIEKTILPLLVNLKKNPEKDYLYWPGSTRSAQCDLQVQKIINITRSS